MQRWILVFLDRFLIVSQVLRQPYLFANITTQPRLSSCLNVVTEIMETGRDGTERGENLSSVRKIPGQHIFDWFSAGGGSRVIIEIIRTGRDGTGEARTF